MNDLASSSHLAGQGAAQPEEGLGGWYGFLVSKRELDVDLTLSSGQVFSWHRHHVPGPEAGEAGEGGHHEWRGIIQDRLYILRQESDDELMYQVHPHNAVSNFDHRSALTNFFRLEADVCLSSLVEEWSRHDQVFREKVTCSGVRLLRVAPLEALVSFICSANNNISRITSMVHALCRMFGKRLATLGESREAYHKFPSLESLCSEECESKLRSLGFGYRAKYVHECARQVVERGGEEWLHSLKEMEYKEAWQLLKELSGVGSKVADCVCLMGLGHLEAVPIDTHIVQVTVRDYGLTVPKSLTEKSYSLIGQHFRSLFGSKAGWAQAILFASEVKRGSAKSQKRQGTLPDTGKSSKRRKQQ